MQISIMGQFSWTSSFMLEFKMDITETYSGTLVIILRPMYCVEQLLLID